MSCFYPIRAFRDEDGKIVFKDGPLVVVTLWLPCGRCIGCRLEHSRQWSVRIMHEASLFDVSSFVTLTYSDENLPPMSALVYEDFQLFMKRVRKKFGPTRFFMCGEYGEDKDRPHFHAGLFGVAFLEDRRYWRKSKSGFPLYRSETLEQLWPHGNSEIGDLTLESAAYMARYTFKKMDGDFKSRYNRIDVDTGEVYQVPQEFARMSLKPGIGAGWLDKFTSDVYPRGYVVYKGVKSLPPRYYDKRMMVSNPDMVEWLKFQRSERAREKFADNTQERLTAKEIVLKARMQSKRRSL